METNLPPEEQERLDEAKKILAKVNLQAQPKILIELNRLARSEDVNFDVVSDLVSQDVGLSAKMLKLASSPMYSKGQKYGSVNEALMAIGFEEFRTCFSSVTLSDFMSKVGYPYKGFWDHSRSVAILCREISQRLARRYANHAYTLGLFHDVGAVLIPLHNRAYIEHIHRALPLYFELRIWNTSWLKQTTVLWVKFLVETGGFTKISLSRCVITTGLRSIHPGQRARRRLRLFCSSRSC